MMFNRINSLHSRYLRTLTVAAVATFAIGPAALADDKQALIDSALSAAPSHIAETAKVMTMKGEVLKEGSGS